LDILRRRPNEVKSRDLTANATDRFSSHRNRKSSLVVSSNISVQNYFRFIISNRIRKFYVQDIPESLRVYNSIDDDDDDDDDNDNNNNNNNNNNINELNIIIFVMQHVKR